MPIVSVVQPSDGTTADAADVNDQVNAILAVLNGHVDQDNLADGGVTNAKLAGGITIDKLASSAIQGWSALSAVPNAIAYNGNRSYNLTFNALDLTSVLSPGMRLKFTRSVTAPTQSTSLNGSTQYYSKTSPAGMTFTDTFSVSAWIKLASYNGAIQTISSRYNGTSGWRFVLNSSGQVVLQGLNGGAGNSREVDSVQSVPLNKWVHVAATLQMSDHTSATCQVFMDGVLVPSTIATAGTNPTAIIQAGNLEIGGENGGTLPFNGKLAQVAVYSAVITQSTIQAAQTQTLAGNETSLISAYSFNNTINDLNANANNLTANGSAVATALDTPFTQTQTGITTGTTNHGIVTAIAFSTNTTVTIQVAEGGTVPTSGGITAAYYSSQKLPFGFPAARDKWVVMQTLRSAPSQASPSSTTWYNLGANQLIVPIGSWRLRYSSQTYIDLVGSGDRAVKTTLGTSSSTETDGEMTSKSRVAQLSANIFNSVSVTRETEVNLAAATPYYLLALSDGATATTLIFEATTIVKAECGYL